MEPETKIILFNIRCKLSANKIKLHHAKAEIKKLFDNYSIPRFIYIEEIAKVELIESCKPNN